jgi:hypothetical protein
VTSCLGVLPLLEQVTRCYIYLSDNYFLYFSCGASSLMRGQVCNLQCNDASSISSYTATDGLSASSSWCLAPFAAGDQMLYLSDNYFLYFSCGASSLMRGRVCNLQCNGASSISSYTATDDLSASSSWCWVPNRAHNQILISLFDTVHKKGLSQSA